jgi:hypothetical protein
LYAFKVLFDVQTQGRHAYPDLRMLGMLMWVIDGCWR